MQQPLHLSKDRTPTPQEHPKIKPIVRKSYQKKYLYRKEIMELPKSRSKSGKAFMFNHGISNSSQPQVIRKAGDILKNQNYLSKFDCLLYNKWFINAYFGAKLKHFSTLSELRIQPYDEVTETSSLQRLLKSTSSLKNLTQMDLRIAFFSQKSFHLANGMFRILKSLRKLTRISLCLAMCSNPLPSKLSILAYLTQLRHLALRIFSKAQSHEENLLTLLASVLPKMARLEQIEIDLCYQEIQPLHLPKLFMSLRDVKNLSHITLGILPSRFIDKDFTVVLAESLSCLNASSIRKLQFSLFAIESPKSLAKLSHALKRFTSLNILNLDLSKLQKIEDGEDIVEFSSTLSSLVSLSSLSLNFSSMKLEKSFIGRLASALQPLKNLNLLKLRFPRAAETTEEHIHQFFSNLKGLTCLQFLSLILEDQQSVNDIALEIFAESLKELTSLRKLFLDFETNHQISNKGTDSLCQAINGLSNLSSLTLNLKKNYEIDEKAVDKIFETLTHLPSLYFVEICLHGCPKLVGKENSLVNSFDAMKKAKNFVEGHLGIFHGLLGSD